MLISSFAKATEMTTDTVRFYVRLGLLKPETTSKGGRHPYMIFSEKDLDRAMKISILQSLGYALREIAPLLEQDAAGILTPERSKELLAEQLAKLVDKRDHLDRMIAYVESKIESLNDVNLQPPDFRDYVGQRK
ncbi:MerR family transcriptional regulator [Phyllobacterium endophyticum]|uniref:MerR family transcriptional regulator n=1 Tax=Phyllobacterium endophyticum TaxID=1149773 RepID=A0A2P7ASA1_9HYPH|nr:MerR family transcriptional regulator [Phyllobacterium endophyticum]MBB3236838.1 DNA-binding transcriptional MerR regulator [Phyllobacterium endophyticum]PSH57102.1 MerR family transcriptional regulator [Phyllobacterium endophyticum]TYR40381.1 MerR family transcriptional regulator [Phyllobacterium endophyticum]